MTLRPQVIVVGASAGAVEVLLGLLPSLPADFPLPILTVVHLPPQNESSLASLFQAKCQLSVVEAEDQEPLVPGTAYFAPPNYHLLVESPSRLALSSDEPVMYSRPSIDVLFETAADVFDAGVLGIILSGANADGAAGLRKIIDAGGKGVVLDPNHAPAAAMPRAAIESNPQVQIMTLPAIRQSLLEMGGPV
jgi:two-component system chemotaxis response regulator CheB